MQLHLRGSGFAAPKLYDACEGNDCKCTICLKQNHTLIKYAADVDEALYRATRDNHIDYAVEYGGFEYRTGNWSYPRRVVFKIEKPFGRMVHLYTPVVTTMEMVPYQSIQFYCAEVRWRTSSRKEKVDSIFLP